MYDSHHQWYKWDESTYKNVRIAGKHTLIKTGLNGFGLMVAASSKNESLLPFTADSEQDNFSWSIRIIHNEGRGPPWIVHSYSWIRFLSPLGPRLNIEARDR